MTDVDHIFEKVLVGTLDPIISLTIILPFITFPHSVTSTLF